MGLEGPRQQPKSNSESAPAILVPGVERTLQALQARLMLLAHKEHHPEADIDVDHPEKNPSTVRNQAAMEWVTDGSASGFRDYVEENTLNPEEVQDLKSLLDDMRNRGSIH